MNNGFLLQKRFPTVAQSVTVLVEPLFIRYRNDFFIQQRFLTVSELKTILVYPLLYDHFNVYDNSFAATKTFFHCCPIKNRSDRLFVIWPLQLLQQQLLSYKNAFSLLQKLFYFKDLQIFI
jgi:hypothetical protein